MIYNITQQTNKSQSSGIENLGCLVVQKRGKNENNKLKKKQIKN